jgi:hypothetical protein
VPLPPVIPRGQRFDNPGIPDDLVLFRGLDPKAGWNVQVCSLTAPTNVVPKGAIRTEELSTRTELAAIQAQYPDWKIATFSAGDARKAGYILMRDPNDPTHVLLYDKNDPDRRPSASVAQMLANAARVI